MGDAPSAAAIGQSRRPFPIPPIKLAIFAALSVPTLHLAWQATATALAANPYPTLIRATGLWSMRLLVIGLAIAPLRAAGVGGGIIRLRRMVGLFAAFYAACHLVIWAKDYEFDWSFIAGEVAARLYLVIGLVAAVLLVPLAATSTNAAIRRLGGRAWRRLHRLVYPVAVIALIHYLLAAPGGPGELRLEALILALCLAWRIVDAAASSWRRRSARP